MEQTNSLKRTAEDHRFLWSSAHKPISVALLVSLLSLAACDYRAIPFLDESHGAIEICEKRLVSSLASPSSYKRIEVKYTPGPPLTLEQFTEFENSKLCKGSDFDCAGNLDNLYRAYMIKLQLLGKLTDNPNDLKSGFDDPMPKVSRSKYKKAEDVVLKRLFYALMKSRKNHPETANVTLTYDADNLYNSSLRSTYICNFKPRARDKFTDSDIGFSG